MNTYDFVLKLALPSGQDLSVVEDRLFDAGCDDALVGLGQKGRVGLSFTREAESAEAALHSALQDVKKALPTARLIEVGPDLVGVTDIAELFSSYCQIWCTDIRLRSCLIDPVLVRRP
jgi:hypothetical protein